MQQIIKPDLRVNSTETWTGFASYNNSPVQIMTERVREEFFLFAQGYSPHSEVAVKEIVNTALFAYRYLFMRQFYYEAHYLMCQRLMKLCAKRLFRLQRDFPQIKAGLTMIFLSASNWWATRIGQMQMYWYHNRQIRPIFTNPTNQFLGQGKYLTSDASSDILTFDDKFIISTASITQTLSENIIVQTASIITKSQLELTALAQKLVESASKIDPKSTHAVLLIQRKNPPPVQIL